MAIIAVIAVLLGALGPGLPAGRPLRRGAERRRDGTRQVALGYPTASPVRAPRCGGRSVGAKPIAITGVSDFDPEADPPSENPDKAKLAIDEDLDTAWTTVKYTTGLKGLKSGVGLIVDLGSQHQVGEVRIDFKTAGVGVTAFAAPRGQPTPPASVKGLRVIGRADSAGSHVNLHRPEALRTRYVIVWLTALPKVGDGYQGEVAEVSVLLVTAWDELDDLALIRAHQDGDDEAFGVLFARHKDRLWAVAVRTTGNVEDAADALQDGLIKAFRGAETFRGDSQVTTWLHRIIVNASLDRLRRNKVRAADPLPDDLEEYAARGALATDPERRPPPSRPPSPATPGRGSWPLSRGCPRTSARPWCWSTWRATPLPRPPRSSECAVGTVKSRCSRGRAALAPLLRDVGEPAGRGTHDPPGASDSQEVREKPSRNPSIEQDQEVSSHDPRGGTRTRRRTRCAACWPRPALRRCPTTSPLASTPPWPTWWRSDRPAASRPPRWRARAGGLPGCWRPPRRSSYSPAPGCCGSSRTSRSTAPTPGSPAPPRAPTGPTGWPSRRRRRRPTRRNSSPSTTPTMLRVPALTKENFAASARGVAALRSRMAAGAEAAQKPAFTCTPPADLGKEDQTQPATYDGAKASLVLRAPAADGQLVQAWSCDGKTVLDRTVVPR